MRESRKLASMDLQALIFDVDGTLAETEREGHLPAFNAAFREAGLGWHWDPVLYGELLAVTGGKERIRHYAQRHDPAFLKAPDLEERIQFLHAAKTRHYLQLLRSGNIPLRPGVAPLLQEARRSGVRLAIATTTSPENVTTLLEVSLPGSAAWFEVVGAGDVVPAKKPAPDIYFWVLERLRLPASACLAIEDSANGLRAALAAGLPTWIATSAYTRDEQFPGALAVTPGLEGVTLKDLAARHAAVQSR